MTASFQSPESGFEHQNPMPQVAGPENLLTEQAMAQKMAHLLPEKLREKFIAERPLEIRPVQIHNPLRGHVDKPERQVWIRATGPLPTICVSISICSAMLPISISCRSRSSRTAKAF